VIHANENNTKVIAG